MINCCVDNLIITAYGNANEGTFSTSNIMKKNDLNSLAHLSTYNCVAVIRLNANQKLFVQNVVTCRYDYKCDFVSKLFYYSVMIYCDC